MLWTVAAAVLLINLPFGFWRAGVRKFSPAWFVAVHAPVPLAVGLRFASGLGFQWHTLPSSVASGSAADSAPGATSAPRSRSGADRLSVSSPRRAGAGITTYVVRAGTGNNCSYGRCRNRLV